MDDDSEGIKPPSLRRLNVPSGPTPAGEWHPPQATASPATSVGAGKGAGTDRDILLTGAGCVLILFAGLLIAGVFALRVIRDKQAPVPPTVPVAAAASTATDTAEPTQAPRPTPTPVSPYTPLPTWTPMGTKQQVSDYRGHDLEYHDDVVKVDDFMQQSITDVDALLQNPQPENQNWQYKVFTQTDVWQEFFADIQASIPPDRYQDFHQNLLKAMSHLKTGADDITFALEFNEPNRLDQARTEIATGTKLLNDAMAGMRSSA